MQLGIYANGRPVPDEKVIAIYDLRAIQNPIVVANKVGAVPEMVRTVRKHLADDGVVESVEKLKREIKLAPRKGERAKPSVGTKGQNVDNSNQPKSSANADSKSVLEILAKARTRLFPKDINARGRFTDPQQTKDVIADLKITGLVERKRPGTYALTSKGVEEVKKQLPQIKINPAVIERLSQNSTVSKVAKAIESDEPSKKARAAVNSICDGMDKLSSLDEELANLDVVMGKVQLPDVDTKIKVLAVLSEKVGGEISTHLNELKEYLTVMHGKAA